MYSMNVSVYPIKLYATRKHVIVPFVSALGINFAIWLWLLIQFPPTRETVFLHYNVLFGVDLVGPWSGLLLLPIVGLVILLLNTVLGWLTYQYDSFISTVLLVAATCSQLFLFLAMYLLVFLNA